MLPLFEVAVLCRLQPRFKPGVDLGIELWIFFEPGFPPFCRIFRKPKGQNLLRIENLRFGQMTPMAFKLVYLPPPITR